MKIIMCGVFYYSGLTKYLYRIFEIYKALAKIFQIVGINVKYFSKQNEILPLQDTLTEEQFNEQLPGCDLLFMWNGSLGKEIEISERCQKLGIPVYYMELGWLPQKNTFYFDRKGVNYNSSLTDWQYTPLTDKEKIKELITKISYYHNTIAKNTGIEEHDYVFVPFQVESDSQIINHSNKIKKMQQLVDYVCEHVTGKIIFKTHPKQEIGEISIPKRCKLYRTGTIHDFLPNCKYVITINSTVGVEALTYYKPIITLGDAFYESRKMTYKIINENSFKLAIEWAEKGKVARGVIDSFLNYLFNLQWNNSDLDNPKKILTLIEKLTDRK